MCYRCGGHVGVSSIHCVGKDDLELLSFCLCILSDTITVVCCHVLLMWCWGFKPEALCIQDKSSAIEPYPKPLCNLMYFLSFVLLKVTKA